ncbi:hypothetical protein GCM10020254_22500 [Streptomyces goshikiensis]
MLVPLDGDRWLVTLLGYGSGHAPPTKDEEFLDFARTLRSPALYDAIRDAEPSPRPPGSGGRRTSGATTSGWSAGRPGSSSSATPRAGSTPCTGTG